jgi:probable HAF family extracellular repeat protein
MSGAFDVIGRLKRGFERGWEAGRCRRDSVRRRPPHRPHLEALEGRRVPSGYRIVNLGSFGGTKGINIDINNRGAVVGASWTTNNLAENAFLYRQGRIIDLGTLGGTSSQADGINSRGEVVGLSTTVPGSRLFDVFRYRGGHLSDLGPVDPNGTPGNVNINDRGEIIGFPLNNGDASLDRRGTMIDLGSLAGLGSGALALNNNGAVVGYSVVDRIPATGGTGTPKDIVHGFLYRHDKMTDLGTLGGAQSEAADINDHGTVVGEAMTASGANHAFLYSRGRMIDLGTLGGANSGASAINDRGQVVGASRTSDSKQHAFFYSRGTIVDLNSLIPANSGFVVVRAEGINDRGQIAAEAVSTNPQDHSVSIVLLNPTMHGR